MNNATAEDMKAMIDALKVDPGAPRVTIREVREDEVTGATAEYRATYTQGGGRVADFSDHRDEILKSFRVTETQVRELLAAGALDAA